MKKNSNHYEKNISESKCKRFKTGEQNILFKQYLIFAVTRTNSYQSFIGKTPKKIEA